MDRERTQDEMRDTCDKACEILKKTNDGDDLDPSDLKLTELAVNGYLNDAGREVFEKLYRRVVIDGNYVKPYLHDIEHITRDHEGYIYYKGIHVEHYDSDYVYSEDAKNSLMELKRRCEFLESKGVEVSCGNAVWRWVEYADEYGAKRLKELERLLGQETKGLMYSRVEIYNSGREYSYFVCGKPEGLKEIKDHPVTQSMIGRYFDDEYEIKVESFIYGKRQQHNLIALDEIQNKAEIESLLASCYGYLKRNDQLVTMPAVTYKTDFAQGYEDVKRLDALLNYPDRSFQYTVVDVLTADYKLESFFAYGMPTLDEIMDYPEYQDLAALYDKLQSVHGTTYVYGSGKPLQNIELPPIEKTVALLSGVHDYLVKHDLSKETRWMDYVAAISVNHTVEDYILEYEEEMGLEP